MVINNKEEYDEFYPYDKKNIKLYPKEYPCVCKIENVGAGIMGDYWQVYVAYFPKDVSIEEAFLLGIRNPWEEIKIFNITVG